MNSPGPLSFQAAPTNAAALVLLEEREFLGLWLWEAGFPSWEHLCSWQIWQPQEHGQLGCFAAVFLEPLGACA